MMIYSTVMMNMISENLDTPRTLCFTASLLSPLPWPACNNIIRLLLPIIIILRRGPLPHLHVRRLVRPMSRSRGSRLPPAACLLPSSFHQSWIISQQQCLLYDNSCLNIWCLSIPWGDPLIVVGVLSDHPHHHHIDLQTVELFWGFWHQMIKTTLMRSHSWSRSWWW